MFENFLQSESPPPAAVPHVPCPVSPLNVPHLGFRLHQDNQLQQENQNMTSQLPPPPPPASQKVITSPIRVPIPPISLHHGLKRSHFSNLAQYLSGSTSPQPSDAPQNVVSETSKRRKTTPKKKAETLSTNGFFGLQPTPTPPHYSGSTSSMTASPPSPPLSHSTEGEGPLEICEESDRFISSHNVYFVELLSRRR